MNFLRKRFSHKPTRKPAEIQFTRFDDQPVVGDADGIVFIKPAAVMLDDGNFTRQRLPDNEPTCIKIDWKKSTKIPKVVREYFLGTEEHLYVYLPNESGKFTIGAWIDGMKVRKDHSR